jgi:ArsR family transcriptional regulator
METFYTALADTTRLRLLNLIRDEEVCVCFFVDALRESQPKISRHLAYLRKAGIVSARKDGKWVHYRIRKPESEYLQYVLQVTLETLSSQNEMQRDFQRLVDSYVSIDMPISIQRSPANDTFVKPHTYEPADEELETYLL